MKRFAINVVILPPDPIMDLALKWNGELGKREKENITLGKFRYLPHVSMVMGCIEEDILPNAKAALQSIAGRHRAPQLHVPHIRTVNTDSGKKIITLDISPNPDLLSLHETIVNVFQPLVTPDADEASINDLPPISADAIDWINHYIPYHCFDNFWPHITLGFGDIDFELQPFSFEGSRLAICHLGNYCTCSTILVETNLKGE
jgi:hypothetical protein